MIKNRNVLLLFTLSVMVIFQVATAHSYYDSLIEADFLGHVLKFEAADLDTLCVDKQAYLQVEMPPVSPELPEINSFEMGLPFEGAGISAAHSASVLRC